MAPALRQVLHGCDVMHLRDCSTTGITNQQCVPFPHCAIQFLSRIQWLQICKKQVWRAARSGLDSSHDNTAIWRWYGSILLHVA